MKQLLSVILRTSATGSCVGAHLSNDSRLTLPHAEPSVRGQNMQQWLMGMSALAAAVARATDRVSAQKPELPLQGL